MPCKRINFAAGQESSAPGQVPIADARAISEGLLKYDK
jgi:3-dehydroquinate dehydratase